MAATTGKSPSSVLVFGGTTSSMIRLLHLVILLGVHLQATLCVIVNQTWNEEGNVLHELHPHPHHRHHIIHRNGVSRSLSRREASSSPSHVRLRLPYITLHPEDVVVKRNEPTTLSCKADGVPTPTIEWFKDDDHLKETSNRMVLPSGDLFFLHVIHNKDTGTYWCQATNSVGSASSQKAILSLALPPKNPRITEGPTDVLVQKNKAASLTCKADGSPTPLIEWYKDGEKVRVTDNRVILPNGTLYFLQVVNTKKESDIGTYLCVAKNEAGRTKSQSALLSLAEPPSAPPSDVSIKVLDKTTALLTWGDPRTGIKVISGYSVYLRTLEAPNGKDWNRESNITTDGKTHSLTLNGLSPVATYEVAVSAFNSLGPGPSSASLILRTDPMGGLLSRRPGLSSSSSSQGGISQFLGKEVLRDSLKQPWFVVIVALTIMFVLALGVLIFLMRQRSLSGKKPPAVQHISLSLPKNDLSGSSLLGEPRMTTSNSGGCTSLVRDGLWFDHHQPTTQQVYPPHHPLSLKMERKNRGQHPNLITNWTTSRSFAPSTTTAVTSTKHNQLNQHHPHHHQKHHHHLSLDQQEDLEDSYSIIESSNDYAEVSEGLTTFKNRSHHNNGPGGRSSTPGPYATTNLINITTNSLYRPVDDYEQNFMDPSSLLTTSGPPSTTPPPPPVSSRMNNTHSTLLDSFPTLGGPYADRIASSFDPSGMRRGSAPSPSPYKTRGCD